MKNLHRKGMGVMKMRWKAGGAKVKGWWWSAQRHSSRIQGARIERLQEGESFPDCRRCGTAVVFEFPE